MILSNSFIQFCSICIFALVLLGGNLSSTAVWPKSYQWQCSGLCLLRPHCTRNLYTLLAVVVSVQFATVNTATEGDLQACCCKSVYDYTKWYDVYTYWLLIGLYRLVQPKSGAKHDPLFNKPTSALHLKQYFNDIIHYHRHLFKTLFISS